MNLTVVLLQFGHQLSIRMINKTLTGYEAMAYEAICDLAKIMARIQIAALTEKPNGGTAEAEGDNPQSYFDI